MTACTCSPCGREFTGLSGFDKHQDTDYTRRPAVQCMDPATLGMVRNPYGRWGYPMDDRRREQLAALTGPSRLPRQNLSAEHDQPGIPATPGSSRAAEIEPEGVLR